MANHLNGASVFERQEELSNFMIKTVVPAVATAAVAQIVAQGFLAGISDKQIQDIVSKTAESVQESLKPKVKPRS